MKKLFNLILLVTTSLLFLSCEKEKYPGAYPYDEITFYYDCTVGYGRTKKVIYTDIEGWDKEKYPMTFWVDNEEVASISQDGYITGKKLKGDLIVHAKVMSTRGMIEGAVKYRIDDVLSSDELEALRHLGLKIDTRFSTSAKEIVEEIANIKSVIYYFGSMADTTFNKISPYISSLDTLQITTYNQSLDLEHIEIKHLIITDGGFKWKDNFYPISSDSLENDNTYKTLIEPYVLKELKINKALEELTFDALPHFTTLDLREFKSLKRINRNYIYEWGLRPCNIIPPTSIEYINVVGVNVILEEVYNSLHTYRFECPMVTNTIISKKNVPNLKNLYYNFRARRHWDTLDIRDYEITDFDSIYINFINVLILRQSVYDSRFNNTINADKYEISDANL